MSKDENLVEDKMQIDQHDSDRLQKNVPDGFSEDYLKVYYGKLFPCVDIYRWLSYGNDGKHPACDQSYFGRREFSFTLENDIYLRFLSFNNVVEMESSIRKKCPFKIDIGPVYTVDPAKRRAYAQGGNNVFSPIERELVFDIDMSDYDDVRYCCSGADVCLDCWPLMNVAIKVLDMSLREDFGFNHILWVYSGRRGVHCWVCDGRARRLRDEQRASIAEYFHVNKGGENNAKKVNLTGAVLHPFLARSYTEVLKDSFEKKMLLSQKLFASEDRFQKILQIIPDDSIASELLDKWQGNRRSSISKEDVNVSRWEQLKHVLQSGKHKVQGLRRCVEEIIFTYTFPRLDMEVSKHMNHLLKAPFCVHPKTGRICVPIDPNDCDDFDPTTVPTLSQLIEELNMSNKRSESEEDWERTSLRKSIEIFRSFLSALLKSCKKEINSNVRQSTDARNW
ncbi:DNA primase small subunit-like [Zingiber officinale]|uniref:DNA primase n=1 Tax=Zingiber officinale TaxID=94328 RepID=A0A8J5HPI1_ZINOF|nr:DNA primase small subunit-like [Zingiber officinale]XP_042459612.1 DNA primase small subunit-like [Zingiber officinale]XP_042459613.1 DNA primase small subunit-like [Zingiber officinale]XP_042459615.1 DNA primase small subunit-like [Zingiber officinale]XP_042459616.1 DNA primase small subunit-like [Zingiber officinale]XP_042459617.1 DNA primase small subunit-like [Zingiber officinale]XP_042459618.1 DNA primase small subunit-like [Zingiber officinale]XP_042459619.1 DNA primase small subuni